MDSSGPVSGGEIALILGVIVVVIGFVGGLLYSFKRSGQKMQAFVAELTPSRTLAEGVVVSGGAVELRASAVGDGAHKVWLECSVPSGTGRWNATANVAHRVSTVGAGYRDPSPEAAATREPPIAFGDDGDGSFARAAPSTRRTGGLSVPRDGAATGFILQLVTLPPCPSGADIFASVAVADLDQPGITFRAFIGVSGR